MMSRFKGIFPENIIAFTSDRSVDFSYKDSQFDLTRAQREYIVAQLGGGCPEPVMIRQVHGDAVLFADHEIPKRNTALTEADGLITNIPGLCLTIRTADCLPIFLCDEVNGCVGLVHAGWKGTRKDIAVKAVAKMGRTWASAVENIKVYFGPAIRSCCYEVGSEFKGYFPDGLIEREGRLYLELPAINRRHLIELGIRPEHIGDCGICTCCDHDYFSYRRERENAGRMLSLIVRK